jgi:hypothetical protein
VWIFKKNFQDVEVFDRFKLHQAVLCKDSGQLWEHGVVTRINPLLVLRDGWCLSYPWKEVTEEDKAKKINRVGTNADQSKMAWKKKSIAASKLIHTVECKEAAMKKNVAIRDAKNKAAEAEKQMKAKRNDAKKDAAEAKKTEKETAVRASRLQSSTDKDNERRGLCRVEARTAPLENKRPTGARKKNDPVKAKKKISQAKKQSCADKDVFFKRLMVSEAARTSPRLSCTQPCCTVWVITAVLSFLWGMAKTVTQGCLDMHVSVKTSIKRNGKNSKGKLWRPNSTKPKRKCAPTQTQDALHCDSVRSRPRREEARKQLIKDTLEQAQKVECRPRRQQRSCTPFFVIAGLVLAAFIGSVVLGPFAAPAVMGTTGGIPSPIGMQHTPVISGGLRSPTDMMIINDVNGQAVVDPRSYCTDSNVPLVQSNANTNDIAKVRMLLKGVASSSPNHGPSWLAAAHLEDVAWAPLRQLTAQGNGACTNKEDASLGIAGQDNTKNAKPIRAKASKSLPHNLHLWINTANRDADVQPESRKLRKALEFIPRSFHQQKEAVSLDDAQRVLNEVRKHMVVLTRAAASLPANGVTTRHDPSWRYKIGTAQYVAAQDDSWDLRPLSMSPDERSDLLLVRKRRANTSGKLGV